ncbi:MAG TPA: NfeD family protein [Candidatus Limnocylindria bacterium]|nr:NfeD family protein [Candidatus Limnocylindria bacterium]
MIRPVRRLVSVAALVLGLVALAAPAGAAGEHVTRLHLNGTIDQFNAVYIQEGIKAAAASNALAVLVEIDSPGGDLESTRTMVQAILASPIPVITWVAPEGARAGSAATFITLAGDVAAMAPNTNIGAASVVGGSGEDLPSTLERKVTNDAVAQIRQLADRQARNADWAESAVREAASISAADAAAMRPPVVDFVAADEQQLFAMIDQGQRADGHPYRFGDKPLPALTGAAIQDANMNFAQSFLHLLSDPNIAFILFTVGFYGILAELFHPNFLSGTLGAIAILLAFIGSNSLPLNVGGLLLILLGIGLFVLELNVTSYGLLTIAGIVAFVLGAFALYTGVAPPGEESIEVSVSPVLIVGAVVVTLVYFYVLIRALLQMRRKRSPVSPMATVMGSIGTAQTLIAPTGIAYAAGEAWSARARSGDIHPGTPVRVVGVNGLELIVEPAGAGEPSTTEENPSHA